MKSPISKHSINFIHALLPTVPVISSSSWPTQDLTFIPKAFSSQIFLEKWKGGGEEEEISHMIMSLSEWLKYF